MMPPVLKDDWTPFPTVTEEEQKPKQAATSATPVDDWTPFPAAANQSASSVQATHSQPQDDWTPFQPTPAPAGPTPRQQAVREAIAGKMRPSDRVASPLSLERQATARREIETGERDLQAARRLEEGVTTAYATTRNVAAGASFNLLDPAFAALEKGTMGERVQPKTLAGQTIAGIGSVGGALLGGPAVYRSVGQLFPALARNPVLMTGFLATLRSITQVGTNVAFGTTSKPEGAKDIAQNVLSAMISSGVATKVPGRWRNAAAQVISDFAVDLASDALWRKRFKDQSFMQWFIGTEIPQLLSSVAGAASTLKGGQDAATVKALLRKSVTDKFGGDIPAEIREQLDADRAAYKQLESTAGETAGESVGSYPTQVGSIPTPATKSEPVAPVPQATAKGAAVGTTEPTVTKAAPATLKPEGLPVTIRRPDGTSYQAYRSPEDWESPDGTTMPTIHRALPNGTWTTSTLYEGETITSQESTPVALAKGRGAEAATAPATFVLKGAGQAVPAQGATPAPEAGKTPAVMSRGGEPVTAPVAPQSTIDKAPVTVLDALAAGQRVKPPKGATFVRVTLPDGKQATVGLADADSFKDAGPFTKVEWLVRGKKGYTLVEGDGTVVQPKPKPLADTVLEEAKTRNPKDPRAELNRQADDVGADKSGSNATVATKIAKAKEEARTRAESAREELKGALSDVIVGKQRQAVSDPATVAKERARLVRAAGDWLLSESKYRGIQLAEATERLVREFGEDIREYVDDILKYATYAQGQLTQKRSLGKALDSAYRKYASDNKIEPQEGYHERRTVTRAAEGDRLTDEAHALRMSGRAFAENTPLKQMVTDAKTQADADPIAALDAAQKDADPYGKTSKYIGLLNSLSEKGMDATAVFDEIADNPTQAGTVLRAWRELLTSTPQGRAELSFRVFKKFAEAKGAKVDDAVLREIRKRFLDAESVTDPEGQTQALQDAATFAVSKVPLRFRDLLDAYRYTNMLSNPKAHERNVFGNVFQTFATRPLSLVGNGEARGAGRYVVDAAKSMDKAFAAFRQEMRSSGAILSMDTSEVGIGRGTLEDAYRQKLPKVLQWIPRFMNAQDLFFGELIKGGETARLVKKGVAPDVAAKDAQRLYEQYLYRNKVGDDMSDTSLAPAIRAMDAIGALAEKGRGLPVLGHGFKWFVPFVRTPVNIAKFQLKASPLAYLGGKMNLDGIAKAKYGKPYEKLEAGEQGEVRMDLGERQGLARVGTAITTVGALMALAGKTTWGTPKDEKARRQFYAAGRRPYSVEIGGVDIPMVYFGPFALAFALPTALRDAYMTSPERFDQNALERTGQFAAELGRYFVSQTPVQGIGNFFSAVSGDTDWSKGRALGFTASQFIPLSGLIRYVNQMVDRTYRKPSGFFESVMADIPGLSKRIKPYRTPDSQPAQRTGLDIALPYSVGIVKPEQYEALKERMGEVEARNRLTAKMETLLSQYSGGQLDAAEVSLFIDEQDDRNIRRTLKTMLRKRDPELAEELYGAN